jgi:adenine/guanine phosphoribosyltransferase-like PRPP-binding protein
VGVAVAERTKREFAIVRKAGEKSHSYRTIEGYDFSEYVIVDDFIDEGKTVSRILCQMHLRVNNPHPKCLGIILYTDDGKHDFEFMGNPIPVISAR